MRERNDVYSRRNVITGVGLAGATLVLGQTAWAAQTQKPAAEKKSTAETRREAAAERAEGTVEEQLTRQHAVVGRILLVYATVVTPELGTSKPSGPAVASAAQMLRSNVDDFHAKFEEEHIFPLFQKSGRLSDLINTLREQHAAARTLTDAILKAGEGGAASTNLALNIREYMHMIQAHTAYEETVLYPQIRTVAGGQYNQLETTLRDLTRTTLGTGGFAGLLTKVAELEKSAGIAGLAQFTPRLSRQTAMGTAPTGTATK